MTTDDQVAIELWKTTDAMEWAKAFNRLYPAPDIETMLGWFANAIEKGRAEGEAVADSRDPEPPTDPLGLLASALYETDPPESWMRTGTDEYRKRADAMLVILGRDVRALVEAIAAARRDPEPPKTDDEPLSARDVYMFDAGLAEGRLEARRDPEPGGLAAAWEELYRVDDGDPFNAGWNAALYAALREGGRS